jgi:hypothetical protein
MEQPAFEIRTSLDDPSQGIRIYASGRIEGSLAEAAQTGTDCCLIINRIPAMLKMARAGDA